MPERLRRIACTFTLITLAACGARDPSSSKCFEVRTSELFAGEPEVSGITVHVDNQLPQVDVPKPHTPTVFHLNAALCAARPAALAEPETSEVAGNGNSPVAYAGERCCLQLSPTLFANQNASYGVSARQVAELLNEDDTDLAVEFVTSAQMSRHAMRCVRAGVGHMTPDRSVSNALAVAVVGQRLVSFDCR